MVLIKSLEDFELFKEFLIQPICYVYYKGSLSLNAHYVGFTTHHGYKYLKRHHKMKKIQDVLNQGYLIQIYTKYDEDLLIKLLKPTENKKGGTGICGRKFIRSYILSVGEVFGNTERVYPSKNKSLWSIKKSPETDHYIIKIPMDIVLHIIEKEKQKHKDEPIGILQRFYQNKYIIELMCTKYQRVDKLFTHLFQILKYCKINCLYLSYLIIHEIYLENLLTHVDVYPAWKDPFKLSENYKKIHCDILSRLKENHYLTSSILDYKNKLFEISKGPSYYYRQAIKIVINE